VNFKTGNAVRVTMDVHHVVDSGGSLTYAYKGEQGVVATTFEDRHGRLYAKVSFGSVVKTLPTSLIERTDMTPEEALQEEALLQQAKDELARKFASSVERSAKS
jgi:RecJ-like exonuclease